MGKQTLYRLFRSEQFDFQAKRALGHSVYHGALPGEVFALLPTIKDTDFESWYQRWHWLGQQTLTLAESATDPKSRGRDLLRASNYFRTAMFFLAPSDGRNDDTYNRSLQAFQAALDELGVPHRVLFVGYGAGRMRTYYFPGERDNPLFLVHGGFDSTNEEGYFLIGAPLIERGYPIVMFEGPGQSSMARDYDIHFTPEWHRPIGAVLDFVERELPELAASRKILLGISLGGLLAARAAACEPRIDGLILDGAPFDSLDAALSVNPLLRLLYNSGRRNILNRLVGLVMKFDTSARWLIRNGMYTFGEENPYDMLHASAAYTLHDVHDKVTCDVLALRGDDDIYGPAQAELFRTAFPNARSYTFVEYARGTGAAEHCQIGSIEQAAQTIVSWLLSHSSDRSKAFPAQSRRVA
jgi:pimeloyl-ACP methyl ester carboxylesterase